MRSLFCCLFVLTANICFAQKQLFLTTSAGWKVSYNQLLSDKPLPSGFLQFSKWSGFSSAIGLEYKFSPNWAVHTQIKTASVEIGLRTRLGVRYDPLSGKYKTIKGSGGGGLTINGHAPAHIQLGSTYYSNPINGKKFTWLVGGGVSYLINRDGFTPGIGISPLVLQPGWEEFYGKEVGFVMVEDFNKNGILLNIHTGIDFNFAPNHHLLLTLQHNEGLRTIWQFQSGYFYFIDTTPHSTTYEHFDVKLRTKGSYNALQLGYKYQLTGRKKS